MNRTPFVTMLALEFALVLSIMAATMGPLSAQATSSNKHVVLQNELSDGRGSQSTRYVMHGSIGVGAMARRATSAVFVLEGGLTDSFTVPATGRPWLTAVRPAAATMRSQATITLHGTELDLGTTPTVRVGGEKAPVVSRSRDALTAILPVQHSPGWKPVEITNNIGTTVLPRGIAVLPLIETRPAAADRVPFELVFRGSKGDQVMWAMGIAQGPPMSFTGVHFGFAIAPPTFIIYSGFTIKRDDGELRLPFQATQYPTGLIYLQALFLSTNPGYAPGAFSNVLNI